MSELLMIIGTSTCHILLSDKSAYVTLYREYETLCEFFANSDNKTMEILRKGERS
jgi:ribulose kinase